MLPPVLGAVLLQRRERHDVAGAPASGAATTTTSDYPAAGSPQPHAVASQTVASSSGSMATSYGCNADGDLTSASDVQTESLTWDDVGQLSQLTGSSGTTSYLYDADGNLLLQEDPSSATLYLSDEQITLAGSTLSGTRYYQVGGQTVAARTSAGQVYYLAGDQEGTQTLAVNSTTLAVTERFYDPYGNSVGTAGSGWLGDQGFQGGAADSATGLTDVGAREYDSGTASTRWSSRRMRGPAGPRPRRSPPSWSATTRTCTT